jgi:hypothetical protein
VRTEIDIVFITEDALTVIIIVRKAYFNLHHLQFRTYVTTFFLAAAVALIIIIEEFIV